MVASTLVSPSQSLLQMFTGLVCYSTQTCPRTPQTSVLVCMKLRAYTQARGTAHELKPSPLCQSYSYTPSVCMVITILEHPHDFSMCSFMTWDFDTLCGMGGHVNHLLEFWMFKGLNRLVYAVNKKNMKIELKHT